MVKLWSLSFREEESATRRRKCIVGCGHLAFIQAWKLSLFLTSVSKRWHRGHIWLCIPARADSSLPPVQWPVTKLFRGGVCKDGHDAHSLDVVTSVGFLREKGSFDYTCELLLIHNLFFPPLSRVIKERGSSFYLLPHHPQDIQQKKLFWRRV